MRAIGGYFELALPFSKPYYPDALTFQSARAAFLALLRAGAPRRVWMPSYICDAMLAPITLAGAECLFYQIDEQFEVSDRVELADGDWLLYVNYFGLGNRKVDRILTRFNPMQIVLDHSQAFFAPPRDCLATIYSPRKFFGLPDGALLFSRLKLSPPPDEDAGSMHRMDHLLKRLAESPEVGYHDFQKAEASLRDMEPHRMSRLTERLLSSQDFEAIRQKRNDNFCLLHERLSAVNLLSVDTSAVSGPLCYPFYSRLAGLRDRLVAERIFVPTYWSDVLTRVDDDSCEGRLVRECLPLPCDQRYGEREMNELLAVIEKGVYTFRRTM